MVETKRLIQTETKPVNKLSYLQSFIFRHEIIIEQQIKIFKLTQSTLRLSFTV